MMKAKPEKFELCCSLVVFASIGFLFVLPWLDTSKVRSAKFRPWYQWCFWFFVLDALVLGLVGSQHPEGIWILIGRISTIYYFFFFLILLPFLGWFEKTLPLPASISESVLGGGKLANNAVAAKPMEKA